MRNILKTIALLACLALALLALAGAAVAEEAATDAPVPDADPTGEWTFSMSGTGQFQGSGSLTIMDQGGGALVIQYLTGMTCDPAEVCVLYGACDGNHCMFSTTVTVDDEGGKVTNTADFTRIEDNLYEGWGSSVYTHPEGYVMTWEYILSLMR